MSVRTALLALLLALAGLPAGAEIPPSVDSWPQFHGPGCDGGSTAKNLPLHWGEKHNIRWKAPIHDRGHSSPVVWGNQVWLTTATKDGHRLFAVCVDRETGKIIHDIKLFDVAKPEYAHPLNSYASPTAALEVGRVYVHFGTYGTACLDTQTGKTLWARRDLHCDHFRGPGSSAFLWGKLLVLHFDGIDVQFVIALDKETGQTVWKSDRSTDFGTIDGDFRKAYSTPIVIEAAGKCQLISPGAQAGMAYDVETGEELWKVRYPGGFSNISRPLFVNGLVLVNTGLGKSELWAVRPDGRGDVTASHVAWKLAKAVPAKPSAVAVGDLIFMVNDDGIASCVESKTGKRVWQERIGGQFSSSALAAEGRIYFFSQEGKTTVIAADRTYKRLAVNKLDDGFMASPAVAGKALFLRTNTHLYRIEE